MGHVGGTLDPEAYWSSLRRYHDTEDLEDRLTVYGSYLGLRAVASSSLKTSLFADSCSFKDVLELKDVKGRFEIPRELSPTSIRQSNWAMASIRFALKDDCAVCQPVEIRQRTVLRSQSSDQLECQII